jgi:hypothetical protein
MLFTSSSRRTAASTWTGFSAVVPSQPTKPGVIKTGHEGTAYVTLRDPQERTP